MQYSIYCPQMMEGVNWVEDSRGRLAECTQGGEEQEKENRDLLLMWPLPVVRQDSPWKHKDSKDFYPKCVLPTICARTKIRDWENSQLMTNDCPKLRPVLLGKNKSRHC